ncbi:hypothetical protein CEXT_495031 [Caerostris extrusa]|uniref:Uncharacterized protein n=1 Tax=Caerostris extrusa TaxID=172846 RepID=A0AAV4MCF8_CAEEX|nr:hypothetical protein CEXT_495031 [Caerostris extrusa]
MFFDERIPTVAPDFSAVSKEAAETYMCRLSEIKGHMDPDLAFFCPLPRATIRQSRPNPFMDCLPNETTQHPIHGD